MTKISIVGVLSLSLAVVVSIISLAYYQPVASAPSIPADQHQEAAQITEKTAKPKVLAEEVLPVANVADIETAPEIHSQQQPTTFFGCTGNYFTKPNAIALDSIQDGYTRQVDTPQTYQIYGRSLPDLRRAIDACAPRRAAAGNYHAITAYQASWTYKVANNGSTCSLSNVKVAVHIGQYMPHFSPTSQTPLEVSAAWRVYASSLTSHEAGHVAINADYTARMSSALQALQNVDCSSIATQAATTARSYMTMLNTANDIYDSQTGHGATQGAIL